ncbi:CRISPR-associated helicase, Cas3 family [Candidatus Filomicrobium marinum]|uniref:CRISPR-associated helicase, Cas3 family n=1 Tax=Candidatus Filomicrobium marinum TaxID=1608628 RepID=A0A0D6JK98_9HYPH|nr:CRISPR-associated helicase/endonuclease Cas3 [Candidatus Filomicrobium marinum]CFX29860.1 CRISPR-associated helicase, Cas3 family [Candidatus Filomicrobium marinum]CPR22122.1 CRISPR-associated helicase, Cas3 family [Candidatus Filomicrobium marinum]
MTRAPWGKFDASAGTRHHLAHHCADVAAIFRRLVMLPAFSARLEQAAGDAITDIQLERLTALVFLHDAGKLHPGFQARGWPGESWGVNPHGHVHEGLEIFLANDGVANLPLARSLHIDSLVGWGIAESLLRAVISHHGRPARNQVRNLSDAKQCWRSRGPYDLEAVGQEMGRIMCQWFPAAFEHGGTELPCDNGQFEHLICGLTTLADWLGSSAQWFPHMAQLDGTYIETAQKGAERACIAVGLDALRQRNARNSAICFSDLTGFSSPNPQQALVGEIDLNARAVILEAETGSGKTEAALWHYVRLFEAGRVDGLYFAVPTRAAAVQLHARIVNAAKRVFGKDTPQPVLAVPGYIKAGDVEGTALPHWRVLWDDAARGEPEKQHARWAAEHSKRYLAAQIAVGTVDQVMMGALTVKHAHLRAASLSRSLLVIDEVHASDAYMTSVQKALLDSHVAVGGYAMLMSATLGSTARAKWLGHSAPDFAAACAIPYPALWTSETDTAQSPEAPPYNSKHVAMETLVTMAAEATAERALTAARRGARVLVIRNTVDRAIETLSALEALAEPVDHGLLFRVGNVSTLHHSRFAPTDRKLLDQAVEAALNTDKHRAPEGRIVIGTQTLEQSLDIDSDLLITDLCPIDVLLQRIGRLHRHKLARPAGFEEPRCIVMVPEGGLALLLKPAFENGLGAWRAAGGLQGVYRDLSVLELTRRLVEGDPVWTIPEMNRPLVESALHPQQIKALHEELGPAWSAYRDDVVGSELGDRLAASGVLIDRTKPFEKCAFPDGAEQKIRTRLGEDNVRLLLAEQVPVGPFGEPVTELVLPGRWCREISGEDAPLEHSKNCNAIVLSIGDAAFRYDRYGLARQRDGDNGSQSADGIADPVRDD